MWMGADPVASARALEGAIYHVHAKDTRIEPSVATRTRLETAFFTERDARAWNYVTLGQGHPGGVEFWREFCAALAAAGYDGVLSIEHEDVALTPEAGLTASVDVLRAALAE
jgi:sugar phosphate isomerase/epimerase